MGPSERRLAALSADERYRLLVEGVTDYAIYILDPDGLGSELINFFALTIRS